MRPLLRLGPNVITDGTFTTLGRVPMLIIAEGTFIVLGSKVVSDKTFITFGSKCYHGWDLYYAWVNA